MHACHRNDVCDFYVGRSEKRFYFFLSSPNKSLFPSICCMAPRKKTKVEPAASVASPIQKAQYFATCMNNLLSELPGNTFAYVRSNTCHMNTTCDDPNSSALCQPICLTDPFLDIVPIHPQVSVRCCFCHYVFSSTDVRYFLEQPQCRKRIMVLCDSCYHK
jgi:hypothetical protein